MESAKEEKKALQHRQHDSIASVESEIGGHEQLKTVLMDDDANDFHGEEVKVFDTLSIIQHSGGDGTNLSGTIFRQVSKTHAPRSLVTGSINFLHDHDDVSNEG